MTSSPPCLGIVLTRRPRHRPSAGKSPCVCVVCVSAGACVCVCARVCASVSFLRPSCDVQICRSTDYPLKVSLPLLFLCTPPPPPPPPPPSRTELLSTWTPPSWQFIMHQHQLWTACPQNSGPVQQPGDVHSDGVTGRGQAMGVGQAMFTVTG